MIKLDDITKKFYGIYCIHYDNPVAGRRCYVGSTTKSFRIRWTKHRWLLKNKKHPNRRLQRAVNKYGIEALNFEILEICTDQTNVITVEQKWIDLYSLQYKKRFLNLIPIAGKTCLGRKCSKITKNKIGLANRGKPGKARYFNGFISPEGKAYTNIFNLKEFCKIHNLHGGTMCHVDLGKRGSYHGWIKYTDEAFANFKQKTYYSFISPDGIIYKDVKNVTAFTREHNLSKRISCLISGEIKTYRGWKRHFEFT